MTTFTFADDMGDDDGEPKPFPPNKFNLIGSIDTPEAPVAEPFNIWNTPEMIELQEQINRLTAIIEQFTPSLTAKNLEYSEAKGAKEAYLREVNTHIATYDNVMRVADRERREIEARIDEAKSLKQRLHDTITVKLDEAAAAMALEEIEARWQKLIDGWEFVWAKAIRNYQMPALRFIVEGFTSDLSGVLVADQMGLGKTLEAGAAIDVMQGLPEFHDIIKHRCPSIDITKPECMTVLWLCPTAIKESTVRELQKWGKGNAIKLQGDADMRHHVVKIANEFGMVLVVGYEQLRDRKGKAITPEIFAHEWPIVVMDEAHKFKSEKSSTFTRVEEIAKKAGFVVPMTGTPIMNKPEELWAILHMLTLKGKYQDKFKYSHKFTSEYCSTYGGYSSFYGNAYDRLIKSIEDMVIRRRKDEVLAELPDKERVVHMIDMKDHKLQADVYGQMRDSFIMWLDDLHEEYVGANSLIAQITRLRQIALFPAGVKYKNPKTGLDVTSDVQESAKLDYAMELIEDMLEQDEKVLVFSNYNAPLHELAKRIKDKGLEYNGKPTATAAIMGGQTDVTRANKVDRFNDPDSDLGVMLGNIAAMGVGLNLQGACSNAIFLDLGWNPGVNEQAEDRLHRMGQKNSVTIHILHCQNTIDEFIASKIEDKANMIEGIMERGELRKDDLRKAIEDGLI